jgi:hypothetical protein
MIYFGCMMRKINVLRDKEKTGLFENAGAYRPYILVLPYKI